MLQGSLHRHRTRCRGLVFSMAGRADGLLLSHGAWLIYVSCCWGLRQQDNATENTSLTATMTDVALLACVIPLAPSKCTRPEGLDLLCCSARLWAEQEPLCIVRWSDSLWSLRCCLPCPGRRAASEW